MLKKVRDWSVWVLMKSLVPPIRKFAQENPKRWKMIVIAAIAFPLGVTVLVALNVSLWPFFWLTK